MTTPEPDKVPRSTICIPASKGAKQVTAFPGYAANGFKDGCERCCCGGWCTSWSASDEQRQFWPPRHSDFRDMTPQPLQKVYELYQPVVQEGRWTEGLLEMWWRKNKPVKHSVHIPCWDSFKWNPLKWRGACFGRTVRECYWTGNRQMRWSRAIYAANLGREYVMPVRNIGRNGYKSDLKALCCMYFLMGCIFSCGIGQAVTCCGSNLLMNCSAWYSCHARERMRRRYKLPPSFGLPPGIDDCLVHFFCFYCAAHQETRELALRGVDGPGMHIFDVLPNSFPNAEGIEEAKAERKKLLEVMLKNPPKTFSARKKKTAQDRHKSLDSEAGKMSKLQHKVADKVADYIDESEDDMEVDLERISVTSSTMSAASGELGLGWAHYSPPQQQEMQRGPAANCQEWTASHLQQQAWRGVEGFERHSVHHIPVVEEQEPQLSRWSVAY
ncbi:hypothetical protein D9Q98_009127 [Chlorella vulgaris]|uniref:Uncharacterized protein n=1 Tax=Chlorella vulgaris TaxID=3077 RepID=A0A9D4YTI5_CHLVU|nr:hypothetical protein D9Q98_009127 [Chlorella vulgaris]